MENKIAQYSKITFFSLLFTFYFLNSPPPIHAITTLYTGPIEKTFDSQGALSETKVYYAAGNSTAVRTINSQSSVVSFIHPDHLGSTALVTKSNGTKDFSTSYYPYGNQFSVDSNQPSVTDKLYTGQKKDNSINLYYYNARYYNPRTAKFISADKAQGPNRYAYVGNNPVMRNDPSGNACVSVGSLFSIGCSVNTLIVIGIDPKTKNPSLEKIVNKHVKEIEDKLDKQVKENAMNNTAKDFAALRQNDSQNQTNPLIAQNQTTQNTQNTSIYLPIPKTQNNPQNTYTQGKSSGEASINNIADGTSYLAPDNTNTTQLNPINPLAPNFANTESSTYQNQLQKQIEAEKAKQTRQKIIDDINKKIDDIEKNTLDKNTKSTDDDSEKIDEILKNK
jgi:RHS repeat-associated protein